MDGPRIGLRRRRTEKKRKTADVSESRAPRANDADSPGSKPPGTLEDQVKTMKSEGQAQPQKGDLTPEELDDPMADSADRKAED